MAIFMVDAKRVVYLLCLGLLTGLLLVQFRTTHMQAVNEIVRLCEQQRHLRQDVWQQQVELSGLLESPEQLKKQIKKLGLELYPSGSKPEE
jgi:hypothetical protein